MIRTLPLAVLLAACSGTTSGTTSDSTVIERHVPPGLTEEFRVTTKEGLVCEATQTWPFTWVDDSHLRSEYTLPLTCSDGSKGSLHVEYSSRYREHSVNGAVTVTYHLADGRTGKSRF